MIKDPDGAFAHCFTPNEDLLVYANAGKIRFWDLAKDQHLPEKLEVPWLTKFDISPCGKYLLSVGQDDRRASHLMLWNLASKEKIWECNDFNRLCGAGFSPDGKTIAATDFFQLKVFDVKSNKPIAAFSIDPGFLSYLDFSKDGKKVYVLGFGYAKFNICDLEGKGEKKTVSCGEHGISSFVVLREKNAIILGRCNVPMLRVQDEKKTEFFRPTKNWAGALAASPDNRWLAISDNNGLTLWNMEEEKEYPILPGKGYGRRMTFSPKGTYFALQHPAIPAAEGKAVSIWKKQKK